MMAGLSIVVNFYMATHKHDCKGAVTPDNVSCNLSRNFVATQVALCNIPCNGHVSQLLCCCNCRKK